jgi:signal transduction histidine kinase
MGFNSTKQPMNKRVNVTSKQNYRILLLEDDLAQVALIEDILAHADWADYVLEHTASLEQGLVKLRGGEFDVVLFELGLIDSTGWETFEALQVFSQTVALIVLTSEDEHTICFQALAYGAEDCISKRRLGQYNLARAICFAVRRNRLRVEQVRALQLVNQQFNELERSKAQFAAALSHELRTPLTSIQLYIQLLQRAGDSEKTARYFTVLEEQTERLRVLADDVLALSRSESTQRMPAGFDKLDLNNIVARNAARYRENVQQRGLTLQLNLATEDVFIQGDVDHLSAGLSHLLDNALRFTPEGEIRVTVSADSDEVNLTVADTGVGISATELSHIFERGFRGEYALGKGIPGNGLGLLLVAEVIRLHGGLIDVTSEVGVGSRFTVTLPRVTT